MGFARTALGRTGLSVARLGVAASYGTDEAMVEAAVERGVNYFWWGALRTKKMARGIKLVARDSATRADLVIVVHAISHRRSALSKLVKRSLDQLGLDYIDVLLLAGCNEKPGPRLMEHVSRFQEEGLVRFLGVSSHDRTLFPKLEEAAEDRNTEGENNVDVFHLRYNAAHRGAEQQVFERMPEEGGPGIVAFASNRWGSLFDPRSMPPGDTAPSPADCYRFVLSHPSVHVACCGPGNMTELQQDLECLDQGPMEGEELERMRRIGEYVYEKRPAWRAQLRAMLGAVFPRS